MKELQSHTFDAAKCRVELGEYNQLLASTPRLSERDDVLPFFKRRKDLSLIIGTYFPTISSLDRLAHEYEIDGDFVADLVIGDSTSHRYVLVEFEDGSPDSVFRRRGTKA